MPTTINLTNHQITNQITLTIFKMISQLTKKRPSFCITRRVLFTITHCLFLDHVG